MVNDLTLIWPTIKFLSSIDLNKEYASNAIDSAIRSLNEYENNEYIQIYGFGILWHINKSKNNPTNQILLLLDKTVLLNSSRSAGRRKRRSY